MAFIQLVGNTCPICYKENLKWHYNSRLSQVDIFKCQHFTCKDCYQKIKYNFCCPLCREEGQYYLQTFSIVSSTPWNTLDEWKSDFINFLPNSLNSDISRIPKSKFGKIYSKLLQDAYNYTLIVKEKKEARTKLLIKERKKELREKDREKAVCSKCGTHCTSVFQLEKHMRGTRCIKLQKKIGTKR